MLSVRNHSRAHLKLQVSKMIKSDDPLYHRTAYEFICIVVLRFLELFMSL